MYISARGPLVLVLVLIAVLWGLIAVLMKRT